MYKFLNSVQIDIHSNMDMILGSSRAHHISKYIDYMHPYPHTTSIHSKSSAKLEELQEVAYNKMEHVADPTNCHVYFVGGLCDITHRDQVNNWSPYGVYEEVTMMEGANQCTNRICELIDNISGHVLFMGAKPCFATIPPASLEVWNNHRLTKRWPATNFLLHTRQYEDMQEMLTRAILQVNEHISITNGINDMATPDLAGSMVERREGRPIRIHYSRVWDGVHPEKNTRVQWARKLQKAINRNRGYNSIIPSVEELLQAVG